jgi:ribosome-associated heat shock protein Hsp15
VVNRLRKIQIRTATRDETAVRHVLLIARGSDLYCGMTRNEEETAGTGRVRVDKWLWAARFFKTRSLAADAVTGGKVLVAGERVKPAKLLQAGDEVRVRLGPYEHVVVVRATSERRGPATVAATLYEETASSRTARAKLAEQLRMAPAAFVYEEKGRPTKRDRRELDRLRDERRND